jgi:hypothetical protein
MNAKKIKHLRQQAFTQQRYLCYYCQFPMWEKNQELFALGHGLPARLVKYLQCTAEHLIARQDDGTDTSENIVAACLWCNRLRHLGRSLKAPNPKIYKERVSKLVGQGKWHPIASSKKAAMQLLNDVR